jgi:hypothetical protein
METLSFSQGPDGDLLWLFESGAALQHRTSEPKISPTFRDRLGAGGDLQMLYKSTGDAYFLLANSLAFSCFLLGSPIFWQCFNFFPVAQVYLPNQRVAEKNLRFFTLQAASC